jgi:endoglucanase
MNLRFTEKGCARRACLAALGICALAGAPGWAQGFGARLNGSVPEDVREAGPLLYDLVGYPPDWPVRVALASTTRSDEHLRLRLREVNGRALRTVDFNPPRNDAQTGLWVREADLGGPLPAGKYILDTGAQVRALTVSADAYGDLRRALVRALYLQRCGVYLNDRRTGLFHPLCHTHDAWAAHDDEGHRQGDSIPATGGWHDAGDYGKYVATTAVVVARLLEAFERNPADFSSDDSGIPESGNGIPDLLDEAKVGLDWMLKMQRPDGAVYRKIGGASWPKGVAPEKDLQRRFAYGISSPDTAKAAAAWAQASRIFARYSAGQSARYLKASRDAWSFLEKSGIEQFVDWRPGDDDGSGPYISSVTDTEKSLQYDWDDRLWAATELFLSTGDGVYLRYVEEHLGRAALNIFEWKDPSSLALNYFLWHPRLRSFRALGQTVRSLYLRRAFAVARRSASDLWHNANPRYIWGSNKMSAEEGVLLCEAARIGGDAAWRELARNQLHYLLGFNPFGISYVSESAERSVQHVSHGWIQSSGIKIPGLLVGGPNQLEQSGIAQKNAGALSWIDDAGSYATNEFAIDYNASLFALIARLTRNCEIAPLVDDDADAAGSR